MNNKQPGEIAVALHYAGTGAPRVTAKGEGDLATRILEIATEHDIPIYQDAQLTRLLTQVDLDMEIPVSLYVAVAEIIAFAYALKDRVPAQEHAPAHRVLEHDDSGVDADIRKG